MPSQSAEQQEAAVESAEQQDATVANAEWQEATVASGKAYRIQILSVTKVLPAGAPDLKGRRDAYYIYANKAYKYCIGEYATREEAAADLPKIRKQFSGAFIIFAEK